MRKVEKVQTEVEVVKEILCDLCGNSTRILRDDSFGIDQFSFATISFDGGYGSQHDMSRVRLEICETCLFKMVDRRVSGDYSAHCCEIPPGMSAKEYLPRLFESLVDDNIESNHEN